MTVQYLTAVEMRHRVTEDIMVSTIQQIADIIDRQKQLKDYIYFTILDRGTSIPGHVESAVKSMQDLAMYDIVASGGDILGKFQKTYTEQLHPLLNYLSNVVERAYIHLGMAEEICLNIQKSGKLEKLAWYVHIFNTTAASLEEFSEALIWYRDDIQVAVSHDYMPNILAVGNCINGLKLSALKSLSSRISQTSTEIQALHAAKKSPQSAITDLLLLEIQTRIDSMIAFTKCTDQYGIFITQYQAWLDTVTFSAKNYSRAVNAENVLVQFNDDEVWMTSLLDLYSTNNLTKQDLIREMRSGTQVKMMHHIDQVLLNINQAIIGPIQSTISLMEQQLEDTYLKVLRFVVRLYRYTQNNELNQYARSFQMWRGPLSNLELPQVGYF